MSGNGDYISREEAEKRLYQRAEIANSAYIDQTPHQIMMLAQNVVHLIPAADVREVKMGEWIPKNADGSWRVDTCSACRKDTHYVRYAPAYNFCPNCGADMMEEN